MRLFRSHCDTLGDRRLIAAVGRDRCAVDVDAALHAHSAAVGQIPCYRHRLIHIAASGRRCAPDAVSHHVVDAQRYVEHRVGAVVLDVEVGLCLCRVGC